jgi:hypothetical protein
MDSGSLEDEKTEKTKQPWAPKPKQPKKHWGLAAIGERGITIWGYVVKEKVDHKSTNHGRK